MRYTHLHWKWRLYKYYLIKPFVVASIAGYTFGNKRTMYALGKHKYKLKSRKSKQKPNCHPQISSKKKSNNVRVHINKKRKYKIFAWTFFFATTTLLKNQYIKDSFWTSGTHGITLCIWFVLYLYMYFITEV